MTSAVIYVPIAILAANAYVKFLAACHEHCVVHGYEVIGVARTWDEVTEALASHEHPGVVVVARPDHLDPNREPRLEVADQGSTVPAMPLRTTGPVGRRKRRPNQV